MLDCQYECIHTVSSVIEVGDSQVEVTELFLRRHAKGIDASIQSRDATIGSSDTVFTNF